MLAINGQINRFRRLTFVVLLALLFTSTNGAFVTFAANPAADLDQCANGGVGDPPEICAGDNWVNGNLGASKAHYFEGDFVPYRLRFTNLSTTDTHTVTIEWDTTKSGKHAIDYLGTYNATETTADPCSGVSGCGASTTFPIPLDPNAVNQVAGAFTLFGGTITSVSAYTLTGSYAGDSSTSITLTFTTTVANPVLAWGGHIASRTDWGQTNSAISIPGSPYHMRLLDLDGSGGNQDRSLSAEAVIFPAHLTIVKNASGGNGTFNYTSTGGLPSPADASGNFSITTVGGTGSATFSITTFGAYTVTEAAAPSYTLTSVTCAPVGTGNVGTRTASVTLAEGQDTTCTFTNTLQTQDVSIVKTAQAGTVNAGSPASYSITVTASGNAPSTGVTLTDNLSATGLSWAISGTDAAACSPNPVTGTLTCNFGTMASGASKTITLTATTTAANCANGLSNTATVSATGDTNTSNNSSGPILITVVCQPDVSVVKTGNGPLNAGQSATFTITVSAGGTGPSSNVTLTDTLPSGTWTPGGADAASCGIAAGVLTCNFGTMASGTSKVVTLSRATTGGDCPSITNTATVSATGDTNSGDNSATATIVVNCQPDVSVAKSGNGPLTAGATATFTITVTAGGTGTSSNVTLSDTLPSGTWTPGGADAASCGIASGVLTCNFGSMASGTSKVVTLSRATTGGDCPSIANTVTVNATGDTNATNNSASATIVVNCAPDVSVVKSGSAAVSAGETATFTITVSAGGTGPSSNVTLTDALPSGTWTPGGADAASCGIAAGVLTCNFGTMPSGTSKVVTLSRATTAEDCPAINNTAVVSATVDTNTSNNSSTAGVTVNCGQITLVKTADDDSVNAGESIGFVIAVANIGDGTATSVTITDALPAGSGLSWAIDAAGSDAGCAIASGTLTCTFGDLAPGASRSVHVTSPTTAEQCGTLRNVAIAATDNDGGAEASASLVVNCQPDVSVTKTGNGPLTAGQTATFTITVSAGGTGSSSNVTLSDTLPAGTWTLGGANAASCTLVGSALSCNFGTMASGTSRTITLSRASTTGDCSTPIANTATVNATVDANPQNNTSSASITVNCPPPPQTPSLVVSKTADATVVTAGAQGTANVGFTVTVTNNGFIPTTAVLADTPLVAAGPNTPAGNAGTNGLVWSIDAAGSDAGCSIVANSLSCNFGTLQPGQSRHVHITAPVTGRSSATSRNDNCGQRVDNMATVTLGTGSTRQSNHAIVDIACLPTTSTGSLIIRKYADNNADSLQGAGESNLSGWTFEVKNNATGAVRTVTTGANGSVTVNDLAAGDYTITEKSCASPCDITKWKAISSVVSGQITVSNRSGIAQVTISAPETTVTFGNQPPLLPSTSTADDTRDRVQILVLLLLLALVAQVLVLRLVARISRS